METYKVINIFEEDYGCEGLPEGEEYSVEVILENIESGERKSIKVPDVELYKKNIDRGSLVYFHNTELRKSISE